ncbi:MAG: PAS domain S-box protein [Chitinophagales bacterium]|nr:PAS domain S-box protein [Chitinophagales bacterium]
MKRIAQIENTPFKEDVFDIIGQIVIILSPQGILQLINKKGCDILGVKRKQALNKDWFKFFIASEERNLMRKLFIEALKKKKLNDVFENQVLASNGKAHSILWHPVFLEDGDRLTGLLCSGEDVTEQREAENKMRKSEENYRTLVNNISQIVFDVSFKEEDLKKSHSVKVLPTFVSGSVFDLTGYSDDVFRKGEITYQAQIHPDDREEALSEFWKMIEDKQTVTRAYRFRHRGGKYKWFEDNLIPRLDSEGKVTGWFGMISEITERKFFETAIKDYEKFFHLSLDLFCIAGTDGYFKKINPSFERVLGYSEEEFLGNAFFDFVHPDDLEKTRKELMNLSEGKMTVSFENRYRCKDGNYKWLSWNASPAVNRNLVFAVARDITEKKTDEDKIRRSEAFLNSVVENIPSMIFVKDAHDLKFVRFNKAGEELLGFKRGEMLGKNDYDFFSKKEADFFTKKDREVIKKKNLMDIKGEEIKTRKNGVRVLHTKKIPLYDAAGKPEYLLGISEDITEAIRVQENLQKSEEKYREIVHLIQEGIWMIDADYNTTFANNEMAKMLKYSPEEMLGKSFFDFMDKEGVAISKQNQVKRKKGIYGTHDFKFKTKDGQDRWTILNFNPMKDAAGKNIGAIAAVVDVTERRKQEELIKENEQKLKEAQKIASVGSWEFDVITSTVTWSDETYRIFKLDPKNTVITRELFRSYVHPDDRDVLTASVDAALQKGKPYEIELRLLLWDGTIRYTSNRGRAVEKGGKVLKLVGTTMDVTEKKLAETREMKALVTGQDIERRRIAEDLHDSLGQKLSGIKMMSENFAKDKELTKLKLMLDEVIDEVRFISHNLMPSILEDFGLKNALRDMCNKLKRANGTHVNFSSYGVRQKLEKSVEFGMYRIAQELLTNALKHASAGEINIQLFKRDKKLILTLEDDGKGFNTRKTNFENTFGLNSITSRTKAMNGIFTIDSQPGKGTVASIEIPLTA